MQVSVIIPTYNRANLISISLETWTKQSMCKSDYEVFVVDNNSTDATHEIVQKFVEKYANFRYLKELKAGATNARHTGARFANSEIFNFCR